MKCWISELYIKEKIKKDMEVQKVRITLIRDFEVSKKDIQDIKIDNPNIKESDIARQIAQNKLKNELDNGEISINSKDDFNIEIECL